MKTPRIVGLFISILLSITLNSAPSENMKRTVISSIDHVLVYKDRALITRKSRLLFLKKGRHEVELTHLPYSLLNDSVRAETTSYKKR